MMFSLRGINDERGVKMSSEKVSFKVQGKGREFVVKGAISVRKLQLSSQSLPKELTDTIYRADGISVDSYCNAEPRLLLGLDNWEMIAHREVRKLRIRDLGAADTPLGWVLFGPIIGRETDNSKNETTLALCVSGKELKTDSDRDEARLDEMVKNYFQIDNFGAETGSRIDKKISNAWSILDETSKRVGSSWETGLLWSKDTPPRENGYDAARKRLELLERRLDKDHDYAKIYHAEINRLVENGYARKIKGNENVRRVWYLPHFGVRNVNKPGKVRGGERVLGMAWSLDTDELGFQVSVKGVSETILSGKEKPTKRQFLSVIMSVYDPLGLLTPVTLSSRIVMQAVWRSG
ncbi:hypothetical protein TKK_0009965 [Trichogramma kaykai]|uniref:Peptidase aspartic putative domain-containing protein n=1 Tax=Trichogramma kaykai TaxID=54128 RepID=A0ABD2WYT2_9HYME